jgi:regulator of nucleoside diphosphate kinase
MSTVTNCPACHHAIPKSELAFCACGSPLGIDDRRPAKPRQDALETWSGWDALVVSQAAVMSYWFMARRDYAHLRKLIEAWVSPDDPVRRLLSAKLARGLVCDPDQLPRDVVTMDTRLEFRFRRELERRVLVDPAREAQLSGVVSIRSPLGALLLGMLEGRSLHAQDPDGVSFKLLVEKVRQPDTLRAPTVNEAEQRKLAS